jgi:PIN domain nuclease of toxin-antitoxin system
MLNLDTHILVDALGGNLSEHEQSLLTREAWSISVIVLWEISKLIQLNRLKLDTDSVEFNRALSRIRIWPLELAVCRQSTMLDFQSDPADELIAATSVVHKVPLLTRDRRILSSNVVPFAGR